MAQLDYVDGRAVHVSLTVADLRQLIAERVIVVCREPAAGVERALVVTLPEVPACP